jgi:hypothetical protein
MSTSTKSPNTIRQGGPGASHENAKAPLDIKKGQPDHPQREHGKVSGGGERDSHHSHEPGRKGGGRKH